MGMSRPCTEISIDRLPLALSVINEGIEQGIHFGAQVYVSLNGECVANAAVGEGVAPDDTENDRPAFRADNLMLWMSACKPFAAVGIAQLWEQGRLDLDAPVAELIPNFAHGGKGGVTTRHLLLHTSGFREVGPLPILQPWETTIAQIAATPLEKDWVVGETAGYHMRASWYILAEIIRLIDGRPYPQYVREAVFEPLGAVDTWVGMTEEAHRAYAERIALVYFTSKQPPKARDRHQAGPCMDCRPGGNGRGPAYELGMFYEMLLGGGTRDGAQVLQAATVAEFTRAHRVDVFDLTFRHKMDWGLGFIVDSKHHGMQTVPYGFGTHCSPRTFGHGGWQSSSGFADPEHGLAVAVAFNGMPGEAKHTKRIRNFATAVYEDLGLV